jgi:hypothetical protein
MRLLVFALGMSVITGLAAQEGDRESLEYFPQQLTAGRLLYYCAGSSMTSRGRERIKTCAGFISGVEEGVRLLEARKLLSEPSGVCVPAGTSSSRFAEVYRRYGLERRADDKPAAAVVLDVLRRAYPCD